MSLTYDTWFTQLANLLVISTADSNLQTQIPGIIDNAEQRIYRDVDPLATRVTDTSGTLTASNRLLTLSTASGNFLVVEEVNIITPSTATATTGTRVPLTHASRDFIDITVPSNSSNTAQPQYWCMRDNATILVGPSPDAAYPVEIVGTQRPTPLSSGNSSTYLTQYLPDLFMAASMIYATAYLKNFGAASDDPKSGIMWDALYNNYLQSALIEESRKKHGSEGWTSKLPSPVATPPRV